MPRNNWTREELVVTLALYFKLSFGRLNHSTRDVIELAKIIGRTPNSVALRLTNYAACDPYIINSGRHGMSGGLSTCKPIWPIWDEYQYDHEKLFLDAEVYLAKMKKESIESHLHLSEPDFTGKDKLAGIEHTRLILPQEHQPNPAFLQ